MPRPRNPNPTRSALRMRAKRGDAEAAKLLRKETLALNDAAFSIGYARGAAQAYRETARLVLKAIWVPKDEVDLAEQWAKSRRAKAGILESDVPE